MGSLFSKILFNQELSDEQKRRKILDLINEPASKKIVNQSCLINYLKLESMLREFFSEVGFCKKSCPQSPIGCCKGTYYTDSLEEERVKLYGKPRHRRVVCSYHTNNGCMLETHRPVICNSTTCKELSDHLKKNYDIDFDDGYVSVMLELALGEEHSKEYINAEVNVESYKKLINMNSFIRILNEWVSKVRQLKTL